MTSPGIDGGYQLRISSDGAYCVAGGRLAVGLHQDRKLAIPGQLHHRYCHKDIAGRDIDKAYRFTGCVAR